MRRVFENFDAGHILAQETQSERNSPRHAKAPRKPFRRVLPEVVVEPKIPVDCREQHSRHRITHWLPGESLTSSAKRLPTGCAFRGQQSGAFAGKEVSSTRVISSRPSSSPSAPACARRQSSHGAVRWYTKSPCCFEIFG